MHPFTKLSIAKHVPKYYHYYFTIILLENYQLISVSKNTCSTLYVILMYYSSSSPEIEHSDATSVNRVFNPEPLLTELTWVL